MKNKNFKGSSLGNSKVAPACEDGGGEVGSVGGSGDVDDRDPDPEMDMDLSDDDDEQKDGDGLDAFAGKSVSKSISKSISKCISKSKSGIGV